MPRSTQSWAHGFQSRPQTKDAVSLLSHPSQQGAPERSRTGVAAALLAGDCSGEGCVLALERLTQERLSCKAGAESQRFCPITTIQFSSVTQLCLTLCNPMNHSTPGLPVHHQFPEFTQTHVHWVGDAIQPSHPLSSPSPPALNLSQHQGLFQWVNSSHQVAKILEFQLQSFQWIFRTDLP